MATETKDLTNKKPEVKNPDKTQVSVTGKPSTQPLNSADSSNPSTLSLAVPSEANPQSGSPAGDAGGDTPKGEGATTGAVKTLSAGTGAGADVDKKLRRAERFGVPLKLSEQEKRNSRAERFGGSGSGSDSSKSSEDLKRKARAERFGLVVSEEEDKKKARLAKFGSEKKIDPKEDEKRQARAIRFGEPSAGSVPNLNGKGNVNVKTAVASEAIGGT